MTTIQDHLAKAKPREVPAYVLFDQSLLDRHDELDAELRKYVAGEALERPPHINALAAELNELAAQIEADKVRFVFRGIGRRAWHQLLAEHPPTPAQLDAMTPEERRIIDHNVETFPIAALAATCIEPEGGLTVEDAAKLDEVLGVKQFQDLWTACLIANVGGNQNPKSLAAGLIHRRNEQRGTTAVSEESLEASSAAES